MSSSRRTSLSAPSTCLASADARDAQVDAHEIVDADVRPGDAADSRLRDGNGSRLLLLLGVFLRRACGTAVSDSRLASTSASICFLSTRVSRCR
jgi:hypothetical protein